jgi:hypothetical protein
MSTTVLTLREVKKILAHTEDTKHSITEFIAFFAKNPDLNAVYSGGKLKALNASRVFGGYLSGALKIEASKWDDLRDVFHKMPEEVSAVIAMGGDVLVGLNNLKVSLDANTEEARSLARANGKAHTAALASMTRAREAFIKAGMPAQAGIVALEKEIELLISILEESRANEKVAA